MWLYRLTDTELGRDAPVSHNAALVSQGLADLPPEERNRVYRMIRLRAFAPVTTCSLPGRFEMTCLNLDGVPDLRSSCSGFVQSSSLVARRGHEHGLDLPYQ